MYTKERIYKTHTKYTNEEKEKIVLLYLNHEMGFNQIIREFDIASKSTFERWIKKYKLNGCITDGRGKTTKFNKPNIGRPRKYPERPLEELSKEELIEKVRMLEDIKKNLVYLSSQNPKINTK